MLEKQGIVTAMRRSARLVRGSWWRVFGIQLLAAIIAYVVAAIIVIPSPSSPPRSAATASPAS